MTTTIIDEHEAKLRKGEEIWKDVTGTLPLPTGNKVHDKTRLKEFKLKADRKLSKEKKDLLIFWLEHEIHEIEYNFCEHTSARIEELEQRWKRIYHMHLEVLR